MNMKVANDDPLKLQQLISQIESLEAEKNALTESISEIYHDAKGEGFDVSTMKQIIKLRKLDKDTREEKEEMIEHYKSILNMN